MRRSLEVRIRGSFCGHSAFRADLKRTICLPSGFSLRLVSESRYREGVPKAFSSFPSWGLSLAQAAKGWFRRPWILVEWSLPHGTKTWQARLAWLHLEQSVSPQDRLLSHYRALEFLFWALKKERVPEAAEISSLGERSLEAMTKQ